MPLNRLGYVSFDYHNQPEYCGPGELVDYIVQAFGEGVNQKRVLPCSKESLRDLVSFLFSCSLLQEEGRFPRFKVVIERASAAELPFPVIAQLMPPRAIDSAEVLRKLAPAVSDPDSALWISEAVEDGKSRLECRGVIDATQNAQTLVIGRPDAGGRSGAGEVCWVAIAVEAPGQLRAACFTTPYDLLLRGGRIRPVMGLHTVLSGALPSMGEIFDDRITTAGASLNDYLSHGVWRLHLMEVWSVLLSHIVEKRHGGSIVVVPPVGSSPEEIRAMYGFQDGFEASLDIGSAFVDFHVECARVQQCRIGKMNSASETPQAQTLSVAERWFGARRTLSRVISAVAELTGVDGCVVMDLGLKVHLFGTKITVPSADRKERNDRFKMRHVKTGEEIPDDAMRQFGTRTNSACTFCRWFANSAAFVVSQDSDLRIFYSNSDACFPFEWLETHHWRGLVE